MCIWALCYSGDFFEGSSSSSLPLVLRVSPTSYAIIGISFGYFTMDALLLSLHPELATREIAVHHAVALLSLAVAAQVSAMHLYLMLVLLTELTTPIGKSAMDVLHWCCRGLEGF